MAYTVVRGAVESVSGAGAGAACALRDAAGSDISLLSSPPLSTLLGRLLRCAGEPAPGDDPGRLSPTRLSIRDSISRRLSARPPGGVASCILLGRHFNATLAALTSAAPPRLARPAEAWLCLNSRCFLSSASFAFFAKISSRRCCILSSQPPIRGGVCN